MRRVMIGLAVGLMALVMSCGAGNDGASGSVADTAGQDAASTTPGFVGGDVGEDAAMASDLPGTGTGGEADTGAQDTHDPTEETGTGTGDTGCVAACSGKQCGDDGCGGSCGACPDNAACQGDQCVKTGADCDAIGFEPAWDVCTTGPDTCEGVFTNSAGCIQLCESVGMGCVAVYENIDSDKDGKLDGTDKGSSMYKGDFDTSSSPFTFEPITTHASTDAIKLVLAWSGARPWSRDEPDKRVVEDVEDGTGGLIDSQSKVGGWGELAKGGALSDGDKDGMPDAWETLYGTNPAKADNNGDLDGDGYTNLETYLWWAARAGQ